MAALSPVIAEAAAAEVPDAEVPNAEVPDGAIVYAIGDCHGRSDLLHELLERIEADAAASGASTRRLIVLGDFVDRGPDSRGVMETLCHGLPEGFETHCLLGNHEQLLLDFLSEPSGLALWLRNGGEATLRSYGVDIDALERDGAPDSVWRDAFAASLPAGHLALLERLELVYVAGDYLFVHAGVRPGIPLDDQSADDLLLIRAPFLEWTEPFGKIVVHGHTPARAPVQRENRIGIDTGAVFSGCLTALRLWQGTRAFLQTGT